MSSKSCSIFNLLSAVVEVAVIHQTLKRASPLDKGKELFDIQTTVLLSMHS